MALDQLVTEAVNERTSNLDELATLDLVRAINQEDQLVALAVERVLPEIARAVDMIAAALTRGNRVYYVGAGTSGRLGVLDASELPPTFGVSPELFIGVIAGGHGALVKSSEGLEDSKDEALRDLQAAGLRAGDVVVALAASGRTPYAVGALELARATGAAAIAVTCNPDSDMALVADVTIAAVVGPEVVSGSTRMKAGTAQKMILNMLSTGAMVKSGKVYGNLMVDVRPTNYKLEERAKRIIMRATGVGYETAASALAEAGNEVKVAVVICLCRVDAATARQALQRTGGFVRKAAALLR
jgi:N-acetylmuramic acid 6-phosphate etherase